MGTKRILACFTLALLFAVQASAQAPKWIKERPISETEYIGIGMASLTDDNYIDVAKQNAFSDIASQIATKVDTKAFMHTVDVDGKSKQLFEEKITNTMQAWVEGIEIVDTYKDNSKYYVYCTLNRELYKKNAEARRSEAVNKGKDYLLKGRAAQENMNLTQALLLYGKGLEAIEPWLFMDLTTMVNGKRMDVAAELYNGYIGIFSGMAITTNTTNIEAEAFKPVNIPIAACLSKDGEVVPNVKLVAKFVSGEGTITAPIETDYTGTAEFYITNITSNSKVQEIQIAIDESFTASLPANYRKMLEEQSLPAAKITIALTKGATKAYFYVSDNNDIEGIENDVKAIMSGDYFMMTESTSDADCFITLSTSLELGGIVSGAGNLNTCYCSLNLKIHNNKTEALILEHNINKVKVLVPTNKSREATIKMCARELMKRVKRELPNKLKKMNL